MLMWKINYRYLPFVDITEYTAKGGTRWSHTGTTKKIILEKLEQGGAYTAKGGKGGATLGSHIKLYCKKLEKVEQGISKTVIIAIDFIENGLFHRSYRSHRNP